MIHWHPGTILTTLLALVLVHFFVDFCLQSDTVAVGKNRYKDPAFRTVPWYFWMIGHVSPHALAVWIITGSWLLGMLEFVAHFWIDDVKCADSQEYDPLTTEGKYGLTFLAIRDQASHVVCKVLWVFFMISWGTLS